MTTSLDTSLRATALRLLASKGKTISVKVPSITPTAGDTPTRSETTYTDIKCIPPYKVTEEYASNANWVDAQAMTGIAAKDLAFTPGLDTVLVIDGEAWNVVAYEPVYSGDLIALYMLGIAR